MKNYTGIKVPLESSRLAGRIARREERSKSAVVARALRVYDRLATARGLIASDLESKVADILAAEIAR